MMKMNHTTQMMAVLRAAPPEPLVTRVKRIAFGVPVALSGGAAAWFLKWPWPVCVAVALFGLAIAAPGLVSAALKLVMGTLKDVLVAIKPTSSPPPADTGAAP